LNLVQIQTMIGMSQFLREVELGFDDQAILNGYECQLVGGCTREEIPGFFGIERKVLGVEFKAEGPILGIWGLGEPIICDGFSQDFAGGEGIEVFVEEFYGGVGVSLVALKDCN